MKYVKNNGRYANAFILTKENGRSVKIEFDRRRVYLDTGNIATTGITSVSDEDYEELMKIKQFKALIDKKEFELTDGSELKSDSTTIKELKKENEALKKQIEKGTDAKTKKELKDKDDEIASLKAKLEALSKKDEEAEKDEF